MEIESEANNGKQSMSIWLDMDTDNHYVVNNVTGEKKRVNKTGEYIKRFNVNLTGQVNHDQRVQLANGNAQYMPFEVRSKNYDPRRALYTPQIDKYEGYTQCPAPKTIPYANDGKSKSLSFLKQNLQTTFQNPMNSKVIAPSTASLSTINAAGGQQPQQLLPIVSFIGTKNSELLATQKKTLFERAAAKSLKSKIEEEEELAATQGDRKQCNILFILKLFEECNSKIYLIQYLEKQKVDDIVSQKRYTDKVKSLEQKTFAFRSMTPTEQQTFNEFSTLESKKMKSIDTMFSKLEGLQTKTFEKEIKLNFNSNKSNPTLRTAKDFETELHLNSLLRNQQIPIVKEKMTVVTKGRFGFNIPSDKTLNDANRRIAKLNFPEYFVEKVDLKKQAQKEQRRQLLKKVIEEMLIQNVKNKV